MSIFIAVAVYYWFGLPAVAWIGSTIVVLLVIGCVIEALS